MHAQKLKILLIEDDLPTAATLTDLFALHAYDVRHVVGWDGMLEALAGNDFHAAVLDLNLGGLCGVALTLSVREVGLRMPPIFIMSADSTEAIARAHRDLEARAAFQKPHSTKDLLEALRNVMPD